MDHKVNQSATAIISLIGIMFYSVCRLDDVLHVSNCAPCSGCSLKEAASTAYAQVCAPYHTWAVRKAVFFGMYALPTREQLIVKLNETGELSVPTTN